MSAPNLYEDNKGKVTKESGSSGGVRYIECHTEDLIHLQCELSPEQIVDLYNNGENIALKIIVDAMGVTQDMLVPLLTTLTVNGAISLTFGVATLVNNSGEYIVNEVNVNVTTTTMRAETISKTIT